jgi:hypothetical protein
MGSEFCFCAAFFSLCVEGFGGKVFCYWDAEFECFYAGEDFVSAVETFDLDF